MQPLARAAALVRKCAHGIYILLPELFKDGYNVKEEEEKKEKKESRRLPLHSRSFERNIVRIVIIWFCTSDAIASPEKARLRSSSCHCLFCSIRMNMIVM